jgi:hypothetical protein
MAATTQFTGLTMPVFTAFSWAGEETAINYALDQMDMFIHELHGALSSKTRQELPFSGLNRAEQYVYLAASEDIDSDIHILFYARPMSLELQLVLTDKTVLGKGLKMAVAQPTMAHRVITELGTEWSLRVQQMQIDEETQEVSHYADLFKDSLVKLDQETAAELFEKVAYLNSEPKWVTPIYLSRRFPSEQISAMSRSVVPVMSDQIDALLPVMNLLTGKTGKKGKKAAKKKKVKKTTVIPEHQPLGEDGFSYISELKSLHLRRGFINMTTEHWPYFAINSRTETRPVTVYYDGIYDKGCSVWRLQPHNMARLVLSSPVHLWLEENFEESSAIQLNVTRMEDDDIQIALKPVD